VRRLEGADLIGPERLEGRRQPAGRPARTERVAEDGARDQRGRQLRGVGHDLLDLGPPQPDVSENVVVGQSGGTDRVGEQGESVRHAGHGDVDADVRRELRDAGPDDRPRVLEGLGEGRTGM
jgi:hypothetical protein